MMQLGLMRLTFSRSFETHSGKHSKYQMSEKDYVFGAVTLYNDMINLFIYVLKMFGEHDDH